MALAFRFGIEWVELLSDGKLCRECQEPIKGRMYQMEFIIGEERERVNFRLCQPCYIQMNDESNNDKTG
jgi:hypothetical protein